MGKTGSWLRSFLTGKKEKNGKYPANSNSSVLIQNPVPPPTSRERRRWSVGRFSSTTKEKNANPKQSNVGHFSTTDVDKTVKNTSSIEDAAATKIQSAFRSYLARKALCALRGLVKLQAMVRGHLVRKQATATLRCMQALMTAQARARAQRLQMAEDSKCSSPRIFHRKYSRYSFKTIKLALAQETERGMDENIKIVEVDRGEYKGFANLPPIDRKENHKSSTKPEYHQTSRNSPAKTGQFDGYYYSPTIRRSSPQNNSAASSRRDQSKPPLNFSISKPNYVEFHGHDFQFYPNYMANTESSRAKVRSQSAPRTRPPDSSESQPSRRRSSTEGWYCPRSVRTMQRSASQAGWGAQNYEKPWSIKLDKSSVSLKDSECGSSSTILTTTHYCKSLAAYDVSIIPSNS